MVRNVTISCRLPEELYHVLERKAVAQRRPVDDVVVEYLARHTAKPRDATATGRKARKPRLAKYMGVCKANDPHAADNDRIDAELAREYGRGLEGEES
jgi:predicted Abi (CAAX) family protease